MEEAFCQFLSFNIHWILLSLFNFLKAISAPRRTMKCSHPQSCALSHQLGLEYSPRGVLVPTGPIKIAHWGSEVMGGKGGIQEQRPLFPMASLHLLKRLWPPPSSQRDSYSVSQTAAASLSHYKEHPSGLLGNNWNFQSR